MDTRYVTIRKAAVQSTQDEARSAFESHDRAAVLVIADRQTRGRGRLGAEWWEAPRAMYASLAVAPDWPEETWPRLSLVTGLAVADAIESDLRVPVALKWPNDVMRNDAKVGGVLLEAQEDRVVIGCGLNLWWPDAPSGFGAVLAEDPGPDVAAGLASSWADSVMDALQGSPDGWNVARYRTRSSILGRRITWEPAGAGLAIDVDVAGYLHVETERGIERIGSGRVRLVRRATVAPDQEAEDQTT